MSDWKVAVPETTTNNVLNPSAETTANFAAAGGSTVTRVTTTSWSGSYSYRIQTAANNEGVEFTLGTLANAIHYVTVRVAGTLPATWDWSLDNATYTTPTLLETYDGTWSLYGLQFPAAQANGSTTLYIDQNGAGAGDFNLDAIQVEQLTYWTTFCDGDQGGCEWNGAEHASTSTRSALSRAGGRVRDFDTDYSFKVGQYIGSGMAPVEQIVDEYAILPGGQVLGHKTQIRSFSLPGLLSGTSSDDLHSKRQALIGIFEPSGIPDDQPFILRYEGAAVHKQIFAYYEAGLSFGIRASFCWNERFALRFLAADPFWYEIGETSIELDTNDTATFRYIAGRLKSTGQWDDLNVGANPTGGGIVYAVLVASDRSVYIGGGFTGWNTVAGRDYIAHYIPSTDTWETVGGASDFNAIIYALTEGPDGVIYAGGLFTNVAGVAAADYVAQWDGSNWTAVGIPVAGAAAITSVRDMAFDRQGNLYIVGQFTNWNDIALADHIVRWNGTSYAAVGDPSTGASITRIQTVGTDSSNNVYVGGIFTNFAGDADADRFAWWDGSAWSDLGGPFNSTVNVLLVISDDTIYVGGIFTTISGNTHNRIAYWNGTAWTSLSEGILNNQIFALASGHDEMIFVGGSFTTVPGVETATSIIRWNGTSWLPLDIDQPTGTPTIQSIVVGHIDPVVGNNYDLFVGHEQTGAGTLAGSTVVSSDGTATAWPRITINRSGGTTAQLISIRNETTGKELLFDYNLVDGETLTIDLEPSQQSVVSSFFGARPDALLRGSDLGSFFLIPSSKGTNNVTCFVDVSGGPTISAFIVWPDTFWSLD